MKFLADVNIPQSVLNSLSGSGQDALDVKKDNPTATDLEIIKIAQKENRIILTLDKDFLALTRFPKYQVPTIVVRLKNLRAQNVQVHLKELVKNQHPEILENSLTILKDNVAESHPFNSTT